MRVTGVTDGMSQATLQTVQQSAQEIVEQYFRYGSAVVYEDEPQDGFATYVERRLLSNEVLTWELLLKDRVFMRKNVMILPYMAGAWITLGIGITTFGPSNRALRCGQSQCMQKAGNISKGRCRPLASSCYHQGLPRGHSCRLEQRLVRETGASDACLEQVPVS